MNLVATLEQTAGGLPVSSSAGGLAFSRMDQVMEFAKLMAVAGVAVPKHLRSNPGACLAVTMQAVEWEMSPFAVANKSYSVNDRVAYEAQMIHAVILRRAPIKGRARVEYNGEGQNRVCKVSATLRDEPDQIVDYTTPALKDINPKNSPLWKSDPDQQLFYYAARGMARRHFPDVILGVYAKDELEDAPAIGPDQARDVTPKGAALAERLAGGQRASTGFNPEFVAAETARVDETARADESDPAEEAEIIEPAADSLDPATMQDEPSNEPEKIIEPTAPEQHPLVKAAYDKAEKGRNRLRLWAKGLSLADYAEHIKPIEADLMRAADAADARANAADDQDQDQSKPAPDLSHAAMQRGWEAFKSGLKRTAVPPEFRTAERAAEADAWKEGWDKAKDAAAPADPADEGGDA